MPAWLVFLLGAWVGALAGVLMLAIVCVGGSADSHS